MSILLLITAVIFLGSIIRGISGLGGGTLLVASLVPFLPLDQTIVLAGIVHWFNVLLVALFFWKGLNKRLLILFAVPGVLTSFIGAKMLANAEAEWLLSYLGMVIIFYVLFVWIDPRFKVKQKLASLILGGSLSGFLKSIFGVGGGINASILSAFNLPKASYLATGAAISFVLDSARLIGYWWQGLVLPLYLQRGFLFFIPATFLGTLVGRHIVIGIPQKNFRNIVLAFIFAMGVYLLIHSV